MNLKLKHKKLYALVVVLCLVLAVSVILTACKKDTGNDNDNNQSNTPVYTEGPECGVYYYDVAGGELLLTLSGGNNFTLAGPDYNKSGTYTVEGSNITLDFAKDDDGTATATITGDTVVLVYNNATMTFLKKVMHVVSFNVDGGSAVAQMAVVNGKTANKPQDPTKAGHVFLGWYQDSALTTPFSFTSTLVKADTTVYAKWVKEEVGPVYTVGFDLGYAGAPVLDEVNTLNGVIYDLPQNPTREGYTFGGWWISMFEDGAKLSYEYTDGAKLTADTTLYALWTPNSAAIATPKVNVTSNGVSWTPVTGANNYRVTIKDSDGIVVKEATTATYNLAYNFALDAAGEYTVEVVATATGSAASDVAVRYYNNKALDRASGLKVVNGILVFNPVANAEKYFISIECGNENHNHDSFDNGKSTYFDFSSCSMKAGGIKFTVTAAAAGYASSVSKTLVYEKNLAPIGSVVYDKATDSFIWNAVENATSYKVTLTIGTNVFAIDNGNKTSFSLANYTGDMSVSVVPVTHGYNSPAAATATLNKTAPAAVTNLVLNDLVLSWTSDADSFVIKVNGRQYTTTDKSYDLESKLTELALMAGDDCTISVTAIKNGEQSSASTLSVKYLEMSTNLTYNNKVVYWPAVMGHANFQVRVNGGKEINVEGKNFAEVVLTKAGANIIEVQCTDISTDWSAAATIVVTAYEVKYMTRSESGEFVEYLAIGDTLTPPTGMTVNGYSFGGWYTTPGANGQEYASSTFSSNGDLTLYVNWIPNEYNVTLNVDNSYVSNITNGAKEKVTYTKNYKLPVPVSTDETKGFFIGWFNALNGEGKQMTDDLGYSLAPYDVIGDSNLYPFFADAFSYIEIKNDNDEIVGYYVSKGLGINNRSVKDLTIPAMFNGKPVIGIADNAFHSCYNIETVNIPDSVEYVGQGAFELCNKLQALNMYDADPTVEATTPYSTFGGALMFYHETSGNTYLELFPAAKTGEYTVSDDVDVIGPGAFKNAKISKVIISKNVTVVSTNAFINCLKLTEIEFAFERETDVTIEDGAFTDTPNVTSIILPAKLAQFPNIKVFDVFEDLRTIEIEKGGAYYSSVDNLICDPFGTKLLYVPRSFKGTFEVPYGIDTIGDKLFYQNPYISKVIVGEHVKSIGADAFGGCTALTELVIKTPREEIFTIGQNAFSGCSNLKTVTVEGSDISDANENLPIYIEDNAFTQCSKLLTVTIGDNAVINSIGANAFAYCSALETFTVADSAKLVEIGEGAFKNCVGLTKYQIHGSTTAIGNSAFEGCSRLNTISLGEGTSELSLGKDVFKDCIRLATIELPSSLKSFDSSLFAGCENIQNINVDENNTYLESQDGILYTKGLTEVIYYPRTRTIENGIVDFTGEDYKNLKKIGPAVFRNNPQVKSVKLGAGIEEIAKSAFENCINLESFEFTGTNAKFDLGSYAFAGCAKLKSITLPAATTVIGGYAFDHTALESFTIPASTTYIGYGAFAYTNLTEITIPANVTYIGHAAFFNAAKLGTVNFDPRTADIEIGKWDDAYAKDNDINLEQRNGVFAGTALQRVSLPKETTYVGPYAFAYLTTLENVVIPADAAIATIDSYAFAGSAISSIALNEGLTEIGSYAFADTKLSSVNIPASVQYIKGYAFKIPTLTSITFTEGPAEGIGLHISNHALVGADLTSIHLPAQLKSFGEPVAKYGYSAINVFYALRNNSPDFDWSSNLKLSTITVSENSVTYKVIDGVLYSLQARNDATTGITEYIPTRLLFSPMGNLGNGGTVTIPKTVTMVDYNSFLKTHLTSIIFEEYDKEDPLYGAGLLTIGYYDPASMDNLLPTVVSGFQDENSKNYSPLKLIKFPSHLKKIRAGFLNSFYVTTPELVLEFNKDATVSFGSFAMRNCNAVKSIVLPKVDMIGQYSFYGLGGLTGEIKFAEGSTVTDIGYRAFEQCAGITSFVLPATVQSISDMAFYSCSRLTSFTVEKVENGPALKTIGNKAFYSMGSSNDCAGVAYFKIPDSVISVGSEAFANAKIIEIEISANLTGFDSLLSGCKTVQAIHVPEEHPNLSSFEGIVYDKNKTAIYLVPTKWSADTYVIPEGVQVIAAGTFQNFQGSYIKLPSTLTTIGAKAFEGSKITRIEIPDNVTDIGERAFYNCLSLATVTISKSSNLKNIGNMAFYHVVMSEIYLPDCLETLGTQAFSYCNNLKSISVPAGVTALGNMTFSYCKSLETVTLNEGLQTIGNSVFANCEKLQSIIIPNSVTQINQYAFNNCKSLKSFYCSDASQLLVVGAVCFNNCTALETVTFGPNAKTFEMSTLGYNIFNGCTNLKEVNLPAELTKIPDGFLKNLPNLAKLTLPTSIEEIGIDAFRNCPNLKTLTIPATLFKVGDAAFAECTGLETVTFQSGSQITHIAANMFAGCTSLSSVNIPEGVIEIGASAFGKTALTEIKLPSTLDTIGSTAFFGCDKLTAINVPASVNEIGAEAFANCTSVETITLNSGLKTIGRFAFANCAKVEAVTIPDSVTAIVSNPFLGCSELTLTLDANNKSFVYENGVLTDETGFTLIYYSPKNTDKSFNLTSFPNVSEIAAGAFADTQLETIVLGERIKVLPAYAFANSASLKNIVIPASVTKIEEAAFSGCSAIESISIPASVISLGNYAFANCTSLANFTLEERKDNMTVGTHLFYGCESITKTYDFPGVKDYTPYMYAGTGITEIVFGDNVNYNVEGVFANSALNKVTFGAVATRSTLGKLFFSGTKLTSITIPGNFNVIEAAAFADCKELVSVTISSIDIRKSAFENCTALTTFTIVKPSNVDPRDQWIVTLGERALANNSKLSNTNLFEHVYQFGAEVLLNCTGITGEISLHGKTNSINNYAFSGMNVTKITINGNEFGFRDYSLAGLTEATTVYFASVRSIDALIERMGDKWVANTSAKLEFYTPSSGEVEITLTQEEEKWLTEMTEKGMIAKEMMDAFKEEWLKYKGSFVTLNPSKELTKEDIVALEEFAKNLKLDEKFKSELEKLWVEYRITLAKNLLSHPKYFTDEELKSFNELAGKMDETTKNAVMQAWFEYKIAYNDANPSKELSEEERKNLEIFCKTNGLDDQMMKEIMQRWPEYKMQLAAGLVVETPVLIDLTQAELDALAKFCEKNGIKEGFEDIKTAWMAYKGSLDLSGKGAAESLTTEEEELIKNMIVTYGLKEDLSKEYSQKLLQYKQEYAAYFEKSIPLNDEENKMIAELVKNNGLGDADMKNIEEDLLAYKKNFFLSGSQPGKELSEAERTALIDFLAKYNLDAKLAEEFGNKFIEYRMKLAGK